MKSQVTRLLVQIMCPTSLVTIGKLYNLPESQFLQRLHNTSFPKELFVVHKCAEIMLIGAP